MLLEGELTLGGLESFFCLQEKSSFRKGGINALGDRKSSETKLLTARMCPLFRSSSVTTAPAQRNSAASLAMPTSTRSHGAEEALHLTLPLLPHLICSRKASSPTHATEMLIPAVPGTVPEQASQDFGSPMAKRRQLHTNVLSLSLSTGGFNAGLLVLG